MNKVEMRRTLVYLPPALYMRQKTYEPVNRTVSALSVGTGLLDIKGATEHADHQVNVSPLVLAVAANDALLHRLIDGAED